MTEIIQPLIMLIFSRGRNKISRKNKNDPYFVNGWCRKVSLYHHSCAVNEGGIYGWITDNFGAKMFCYRNNTMKILFYHKDEKKVLSFMTAGRRTVNFTFFFSVAVAHLHLKRSGAVLLHAPCN